MPKRESPESHSVSSWLPHQQQMWRRTSNPALLHTSWEATGTAPIILSPLLLAVTEVQSHPLWAQDTPFPVLLSCLTQLPKLCIVPFDPMHKQLLETSVFSNFSEHPLPSATSIPFQTLAWPLASRVGSVFCPTSLLPEPWVLNSVTSSQFLPPASAIHVCGSVHSGLKTWVQSQRATQWKERIYSCELFSDLYMTSVACVFLASVQTTCLLVQTYMEAKYQYT